MVQRRVLRCGLCRSKEKCLKPDLKCVNRWSSSTVQRKRVPVGCVRFNVPLDTFLESWSSNRETTSSSVQVVRRNWQKLLCGRPQWTRLIVWADQISKVAWLFNTWLRYNYFRFLITTVRHIGILLAASTSTCLSSSASHFSLALLNISSKLNIEIVELWRHINVSSHRVASVKFSDGTCLRMWNSICTTPNSTRHVNL